MSAKDSEKQALEPYSSVETSSATTPDVESEIESDELPAYSAPEQGSEKQPSDKQESPKECPFSCRRCKRKQSKRSKCKGKSKKRSTRCRMAKFLIVFFFVLTLFGTFTARTHCRMNMGGREHGSFSEIDHAPIMAEKYNPTPEIQDIQDIPPLKPHKGPFKGEHHEPGWFDIPFLNKWFKHHGPKKHHGKNYKKFHGKHGKHYGKKFHGKFGGYKVEAAIY